jgi:hypothetical protein
MSQVELFHWPFYKGWMHIDARLGRVSRSHGTGGDAVDRAETLVNEMQWCWS